MPESSETTPLLASSQPSERGEHEPQDAPAEEQTPFSLKAIVVLSALSTAFAVLGIAFNVSAVAIGTASAGTYYMPWGIRENVYGMIGVSVFAFLASFFNLSRLKARRAPLWPLVNLVIDAAVTYYMVAMCPEGLVDNFDNSPTYWLPDQIAFLVARKVQILAGLGLGFGVALGVTHFALFLLRGYLWFNGRSWGGSQILRVPLGEFKVEFSIKLLRHDESQV